MVLVANFAKIALYSKYTNIRALILLSRKGEESSTERVAFGSLWKQAARSTADPTICQCLRYVAIRDTTVGLFLIHREAITSGSSGQIDNHEQREITI